MDPDFDDRLGQRRYVVEGSLTGLPLLLEAEVRALRGVLLLHLRKQFGDEFDCLVQMGLLGNLVLFADIL